MGRRDVRETAPVTDRDALRDRYEFLKTEVLQHMVEDDAESYGDDALEVAMAVLHERGIEAKRPPPPTLEDRAARAKDLRLSGFNRILWGGSLTVIGTMLTLAADGRILFYGLITFGVFFVGSGLSARGDAETIEKELEDIRKAEIERVAGSLSPVADDDGGALSLPAETDAPRSR